jgi:hypothetical protein
MAFGAAPALASVPATVIQSASLGAAGFGSLAVDDAGQHLFVSQPAGNDVQEYDFQGNLLATIPNVYGAYGMSISGGVLYVAESTTGSIVQIPLAGPLVPTTVATGLLDPTWLVSTGGKLWAAEQNTGGGVGWGNVVSVDPSTGAVAGLTTSQIYEPDLGVSPGDPSTLFVAEDGLSPGSVYRYDVSGATPTLVASNTFTDQENIEGLAISPDGGRVIPAAGYPYKFEEMNAATLAPDGVSYPGAAYPAAVAVSASGMLATGLFGYDSPDLMVYPLGKPAASFTATIADSNGYGDVVRHGLALSADGTRLFAVTGQAGSSTADSLATLQLYPPTATIASPASGQIFAVGQQVSTSYSCSDAQGPGITSCVDSNGATGGSGRLDTGTPGIHTYIVTATSGDGATGTANMSYTVAAAPQVSIATPSANATYIQGQTVDASYSCQDGAYGPGIAAGGCAGTVVNGSAINTTTPGTHSFAVTATSTDGQTTTQTISYSVAAPTADLSASISGPAQAADNSSFTETVTVKNLGPSSAAAVTTTITIPSGTTVSSAGGGTIAGGQVRWNLASLAAGATVTYTVTLHVGQHVSGTASVTASTSSTTSDPNTSNNGAVTNVTFVKGK